MFEVLTVQILILVSQFEFGNPCERPRPTWHLREYFGEVVGGRHDEALLRGRPAYEMLYIWVLEHTMFIIDSILVTCPYSYACV